ncbi:uncharacterized protein [Melanerpes formicivorus]|uniref:uncharacterized protein n=1 Tax=Melanerpes formicivorus TaxID=211600 RepID=UPI00358E032E
MGRFWWMKMADQRQLALPARGLLLCILALHLCIQDPLATAEHNAVASTSVATTSKASMGTNKTTVAAANKASVAATKKTSVATTHKTSVATTTKASESTSSASVAAANKASVATTTKASESTSSALVAPTNKASVAAANKASVAPTAKTLEATASTSSMATASNPSMATASSPSMATASNASVTTANNVSVATNTSVNGTEGKLLTCQSFQCSGERCYQDVSHINETVTCHNETHCELYRFSSVNYTARCSSRCSEELCSSNSSRSGQHCALDCCATRLCLRLNASAYGDLPPTTVPPKTTTTTRAPPRNGKVCAAFSCHGDGCFKGKKTIARCVVGQDFCEMKKTGLNYVAGCSKVCKAAKPVCASGMKAACFQECCPATLKASCLKLDGKVHVNSAGQVIPAPVLKLMALGVVVFLNSRVSMSLWV